MRKATRARTSKCELTSSDRVAYSSARCSALRQVAIVTVDGIILAAPVEHDPIGTEVPGPPWVVMPKQHASNILVDAFAANHLMRDALTLKIRISDSPTPGPT